MTSVAIVVPCFNEGAYIERLLNSLVALDHPKDQLEVLLCDGGSTDGTREIVSKYSDNHSFIQLLNNPHQFTPHALNIGLKHSQADVKIILGAHAEVYPDFVAQNLKALKKHPDAGCVGGIIENVYENTTAQVIGKAMSSPFGVGNAHFRTGNFEGWVDTAAFGAYRAEVFDDIGYFDEVLVRNQDDEFNFRLTQSHWKIWLSPSIKSKYFVRGNFGKLFKQYYQYGYWKVYVNRQHKVVTTVRQLFPFFLVGGVAFGPVLAFLFPQLWFVYFGVVKLYLLAGAIASLLTKPGAKGFLAVWRAFVWLHFSYGLGYWVGVFDFLLMRKSPSARNSTSSR